MALGAVWGMTVDPARAAGHVDHDGTTYYFCSKGCVARFSADPKAYLEPALLTIGGLKRKPNLQSAIGNLQSGEWICPMHPEVVSDKPGACPMCGMALEPRVADLTGSANPEL